MPNARVLKKQADLFTVESEGKIFVVVARKNLKRDGIFVGDEVMLDSSNAICAIKKRKNLLVRPPLANLDRMFITIAPLPKPDFYLLDKLLLFCTVNKIDPIICVNKQDIDTNLHEVVKEIYAKIAPVVCFSAKNESVLALKEQIVGLCALAGQSAVGKSSIINALKNEDLAQVGDFSKKVMRGKQTTRTVELFKFENGYLADTAGFSKLDESLLGLEFDEVKNYYPEFVERACGCKYRSCLHEKGKDCAVVHAVEHGEISKIRHENYLKLLSAIKIGKKF